MKADSKVVDLMATRWKVIADYPSNDEYKVGQIIENIGPHYSELLSRYPHLFQPIPWWSDRKPEDMPEYVKNIYTSVLLKVFRWRADNHFFDTLNKNESGEAMYYQPATFAEYTEFTNSKPHLK